MSNTLLLNLQLYCSIYMTAVIWTTQLLIYPNFLKIPATHFYQFHQFHIQKITWIVAPAMLLEVLFALLLPLQSPIAMVNLLLLLTIWICTFLLSIRYHNLLEKFGHSPEIIKKLVSTNWTRTLLWTCRCILIFFQLNSVT